MPRRPKSKFDTTALTKGQLRKLNALRKSLTPEIADRAFSEWLTKFASHPSTSGDKNAGVIAETLGRLVKARKLSVPRGGYLVTRGRGRVIVERARAK
jgi:hypothetical protein